MGSGGAKAAAAPLTFSIPLISTAAAAASGTQALNVFSKAPNCFERFLNNFKYSLNFV